MRILQRGNRLSITPVDPAEWAFVLKLARRKGPVESPRAPAPASRVGH